MNKNSLLQKGFLACLLVAPALLSAAPHSTPNLIVIMAEDIQESKNLYTAFPEKVEQLEALRKAWDAELIDPTFLGLIHTESSIQKWGRPKRWL